MCTDFFFNLIENLNCRMPLQKSQRSMWFRLPKSNPADVYHATVTTNSISITPTGSLAFVHTLLEM